eukprot:scaffold3916_cov27-Prasinocladus_malaysianus.AAC.2
MSQPLTGFPLAVTCLDLNRTISSTGSRDMLARATAGQAGMGGSHQPQATAHVFATCHPQRAFEACRSEWRQSLQHAQTAPSRIFTLEVSIPEQGPNPLGLAEGKAQMLRDYLMERLRPLLPNALQANLSESVLGFRGLIGATGLSIALRVPDEAQATVSNTEEGEPPVIQDVVVSKLVHADGQSSLPSVMSKVLREVYGPLPPEESAEERWKQVNVVRKTPAGSLTVSSQAGRLSIRIVV